MTKIERKNNQAIMIKDNDQSRRKVTIVFFRVNQRKPKKREKRWERESSRDRTVDLFIRSNTSAMEWNYTNATGPDTQASASTSFLNTIQLLTSALTPVLELARIFLSVITFVLVHYSPLYRTTSFGLHIRCLAIYDACRIVERLFYWFPPLSLFLPK